MVRLSPGFSASHPLCHIIYMCSLSSKFTKTDSSIFTDALPFLYLITLYHPPLLRLCHYRTLHVICTMLYSTPFSRSRHWAYEIDERRVSFVSRIIFGRYDFRNTRSGKRRVSKHHVLSFRRPLVVESYVCGLLRVTCVPPAVNI